MEPARIARRATRRHGGRRIDEWIHRQPAHVDGSAGSGNRGGGRRDRAGARLGGMVGHLSLRFHARVAPVRQRERRAGERLDLRQPGHAVPDSDPDRIAAARHQSQLLRQHGGESLPELLELRRKALVGHRGRRRLGAAAARRDRLPGQPDAHPRPGRARHGVGRAARPAAPACGTRPYPPRPPRAEPANPPAPLGSPRPDGWWTFRVVSRAG